MEFNDLQTELKYMIFDLLIDKGEKSTYKLVCKEWNDIYNYLWNQKYKLWILEYESSYPTRIKGFSNN